LLVKELLTSKSNNADEVAVIENRIKAVEDKRLSIVFNAAEKANVILGHETQADRQRIMNNFISNGR